MGFEQLAELKKQLAAARAQSAPAAKAEARSGAKAEGRSDARRDARNDGKPGAKPAKPNNAAHSANSGTAPGAKADRRPGGKSSHQRRGGGPGADAGAARPAAAPAADAKPVDPVVKSIGRLQKRFPNAFPKNPAPKLALKVGIFEDLVVHAKDLSLSEAELRDAIKTWCRGSRYWKSLVEGAARVDLTGAEAGKVTAQEAAGAQRLQAHRAAKSAKAAAASADSQKETPAAGSVDAAAPVQEAAQDARKEAPHEASQSDDQKNAQAGSPDASPDDKVAAQSANVSETTPADLKPE
ncbi:ProQ/FINO family protein [Paraburkholderia strydomiana]|uniref:ProQ/FINO family protein n=1 Tax=Paraburkholderia strydomiana TaxID=1245417 RepID=UPI001BEB9B2F|nr:ProQ/FinO family protein [Paraburkholderia strydomiana]MBT2795077.1 ProQ/FinO family protein [Paraburkholderia strydomiana]